MDKGNEKKTVRWTVFSVMAMLLFAGPLIIRGDYARHTLIMIFINAVFAEGLWIMVQAGEFSFGQSAFGAIGGYFTAILSSKYNIDPWITFPIGGLAASAAAIMLGSIISHLRSVYFAICTFAFMELIRGLCINLVSLTGGAAGIPGIPTPYGLEVIFGNRTLGFYYLALGVMAITLFAVFAFTRSRLFLLFRAVDHNSALSSSVGIYVRKYKLQAFFIGCLFTGLAGAVQASYLTHIAPVNFGFLVSLDIVLYCYVGGIASAIGPLVGAVVMTFVVFSLTSAGYYKIIIYGAIITFAVLALRGGLIELPETILNFVKRSMVRKELRQN